ncbi:glucoamylase family protein [Neorhizobium alkalisoli]|uniref:Glycoamylase-like domain-containing protein n=1 Tax=Neorhizobium alkalisoli TaxID=528178 RepID=A0A561QXF7_9HYPH|nr:glucoamylase family protein [Neorhizobium alkalisoli]TWF55048.1 hypothetical protein FHW37_103922 [Neorhizobium alkalisoli]
MDAELSPAEMPLDDLLDQVQRATFRYFWDGAHPVSGLPYDKCLLDGTPGINAVSISGTGFGVMAIIVAAERGWISRDQAFERIETILTGLEKAPRYHGAFSHFIDPVTSEMIPFSALDDGGDIVETTLLMQGLICARHYFSEETFAARSLGDRITRMFDEVEWTWFSRGDHGVLYWHWSPVNGWAMNLPIQGWNEALSAYVLGAGSATFPIPTQAYHAGWARNGAMLNGEAYYGTTLPLGEPYGGPLFLSQYSFCALDPRGLTDTYADYWQQAVAHARINRAYCLTVPEYKDAGVWGLTASEAEGGYNANSPTNDRGAIAPTAALGSFPFVPQEAEQSLRAMLAYDGGRLMNRYGLADAFSPKNGWIAPTYIAIDQGPIVAMIENHRSGLLWNLFMQAPEVQRGLDRLEFSRASV